ncbi:MAG: hypothetical protein AAFY88_22735, partial [Acidobacteriota bacterium]
MTSPVGAPQGAHYRLRLDDPSAPLTFVIEEIAREGRGWLYGPFSLDVDKAIDAHTDGLTRHVDTVLTAPHAEVAEDGAVATPRRPSAAVTRRLERAKLAAPRPATSPPALVRATKAAADRVKILVDRDGLQFVAADDLAVLLGGEGADVSGQLEDGTLGLRRAGRAVAHWAGQRNGQRGLYFYGRALRDLYADYDVYWLGPTGAATPDSVNAGPAPSTAGGTFTAEALIEEDLFAGTFVARDPDLDYWHWKGLIAGHASFGAADFELPLPDVDGAQVGQITVHLRGAGASQTPLEHHAEVEVGGRFVGEAFFDDLDDFSATFALQPGDLDADGVSTVTVRALLDTGALQSFFYVDSFDVTYGRRLLARDGALEGAWPAAATSLTVGRIGPAAGGGAPEVEVLDVTDQEALGAVAAEAHVVGAVAR